MLIRYAFSVKNIIEDETFHRFENIISEERYKKMQKYRFRADAIRSLFAEVLLRYGLKKDLGLEGMEIEFEKNDYGKPELKKNKQIHFNVSHSGDWVVCAISDQPVGVDVELEKEHDLQIAKRFYGKKEYDALLKSKNQKELFITFWTLKESYVKAEGKGLSIPFESFAFTMQEKNISLEVDEKPCNTYEFQTYPIAEGVQVATCSMQPIEGRFKIVTLEELKKMLLG